MCVFGAQTAAHHRYPHHNSHNLIQISLRVLRLFFSSPYCGGLFLPRSASTTIYRYYRYRMVIDVDPLQKEETS